MPKGHDFGLARLTVVRYLKSSSLSRRTGRGKLGNSFDFGMRHKVLDGRSETR